MFRKVAILFVLLFAIVHSSALAAPLAEVEQEGNPWWLWLLVFAVIALFVGFMLWWWLHEPEEEEITTAHHDRTGVVDTAGAPEATARDGQLVAAYDAPDDMVDTLEVEAVAVEPEVIDVRIPEPTFVQQDDLTIVEGIGPAIQKVLYAAGISTYRDLADTAPERLEAILQEADRNLARLFNPGTWPEQAQLAAEGKWEELRALKDSLNAGRRG